MACPVQRNVSARVLVDARAHGADLVSLSSPSSQSGTPGGSVDGNALLIDDDGTGYVAFASVGAGGNRSANHMVTIDRLAPDLLSSTRQLAAPIFPDSFVEGGA